MHKKSKTCSFNVLALQTNLCIRNSAVTRQDTRSAANNGTITINQAGVQKGQFTVDQSGNTTINLTDSDTTTNTQNQYAISCVNGDNSDEEKIRLSGSGHNGSTTDDIVLEAGTGLTIARNGDKITFTNSNPTDSGTYVTSVSGTAPVVSSGGTTPAISVTTAAVANGGASLATGNQIYDHVTTRISGLTSNAGTVTSVVAGHRFKWRNDNKFRNYSS